MALKLYKCHSTDLVHFFASILDKKWDSWNDSWGFPFFRVGQVIPCTALWDVLSLESIHRFNPFSILCVFFLFIVQQLDINRIYWERPLQFRGNPQSPLNKLGCTGQTNEGVSHPPGGVLCVCSHIIFYMRVCWYLAVKVSAKCQ